MVSFIEFADLVASRQPINENIDSVEGASFIEAQTILMADGYSIRNPVIVFNPRNLNATACIDSESFRIFNFGVITTTRLPIIEIVLNGNPTYLDCSAVRSFTYNAERRIDFNLQEDNTF